MSLTSASPREIIDLPTVCLRHNEHTHDHGTAYHRGPLRMIDALLTASNLYDPFCGKAQAYWLNTVPAGVPISITLPSQPGGLMIRVVDPKNLKGAREQYLVRLPGNIAGLFRDQEQILYMLRGLGSQLRILLSNFTLEESVRLIRSSHSGSLYDTLPVGREAIKIGTAVSREIGTLPKDGKSVLISLARMSDKGEVLKKIRGHWQKYLHYNKQYDDTYWVPEPLLLMNEASQARGRQGLELLSRQGFLIRKVCLSDNGEELIFYRPKPFPSKPYLDSLSTLELAALIVLCDPAFLQVTNIHLNDAVQCKRFEAMSEVVQTFVTSFTTYDYGGLLKALNLLHKREILSWGGDHESFLLSSAPYVLHNSAIPQFGTTIQIKLLEGVHFFLKDRLSQLPSIMVLKERQSKLRNEEAQLGIKLNALTQKIELLKQKQGNISSELRALPELS